MLHLIQHRTARNEPIRDRRVKRRNQRIRGFHQTFVRTCCSFIFRNTLFFLFLFFKPEYPIVVTVLPVDLEPESARFEVLSIPVSLTRLDMRT